MCDRASLFAVIALVLLHVSSGVVVDFTFFVPVLTLLEVAAFRRPALLRGV
ncbi:MAG: hypothetical protein JO212_16775 [Acetobacteraceae bacterium]|nr:hypothetical protein [Acetobacteraceae bacterium]